MSCLTFEQMFGYAENKLSPQGRAEVDRHLAVCELCNEAMEGFAAFPDKAKLQPMVASLNEQIQSRYAFETATEVAPAFARKSQSIFDSIRAGLASFIDAVTTPRYNLRLAYVTAAVFLVGVVSALYMNRETPNEKLFAEYYQPYPNIASAVRGELTAEKLPDAMQHYDAGDFKAALDRLEEILVAEPDNAAANFYAGVSYLKVEESERAVASLQKVIALNDSKFSEPAEWYLALAFLQQNDLAKTRAVLNEILTEEQLYKEQAKKLLERLHGNAQ